MLTGEIRSQVNAIWNAFWTGGISNPLEVIEQITYLLFLRRIDELQEVEELKATRLKKPIERQIFPKGKDAKGMPYEQYRWSRFKNAEARSMYDAVSDHVFPWLRTLGGNGSAYAQHMKDARFTIPTPQLLAKVVDLIEKVPMQDRDTKGDLYEYMLGKIASAGQNGQFRTPRHIIKLMVEMVEGRVYVSTYPTMMGLIDETVEGQRRFGPGHFDLIVIDEAHRSIYQKYRAIFEYFDSLLIGLTATPKDEIDRNTYNMFDLETGVPTDAYGLDDAVRDGFLVPPKSVSVPLKFQRQGIKYDDLSEEEKDQWDAIDWDDQGNVPTEVAAEAINRWLFNTDTVDKVLEHLMLRGQKVAGGDRLGKTIIFAKNHEHAVFIQDRFDINYPNLKGHFARVIDFKTEYVQSLIDDFSNPDKMPHVAISVDMLDTGIDIPEIVNLVFFKLVHSKTKFWQMIGRGTRLRPDLFGPGEDKTFFYVFDYCQNLEFFSQNPDVTDGATAASLSKRLFTARLSLIAELDKRPEQESEKELRSETATRLREEVAAMNTDNFIVRPKRRLVEVYRSPDSWKKLGAQQREELSGQVAGLPTELPTEDEEAKRFDLLMLRLQLAVLRADPTFGKLRDQVISIADALEAQSSIPMIHERLELIQELQTDEYWQDITAPMLEIVRKRLRDLIKLIEKAKRNRIYTAFVDEIGPAAEIAIMQVSKEIDFERFKAKVQHFLKAHSDQLAIHKLRRNQQLTSTDLDELEKILIKAAGAPSSHIDVIKKQGLVPFIRSLVGLDREAAKAAFASFLSGKDLNSRQIEFVNLIIDHLTEHGTIEPSRLYESPFTDFNPRGVEGVFNSAQVKQLMSAIANIQANAA